MSVYALLALTLLAVNPGELREYYANFAGDHLRLRRACAELQRRPGRLTPYYIFACVCGCLQAISRLIHTNKKMKETTLASRRVVVG